jgi:hypothetical protein
VRLEQGADFPGFFGGQEEAICCFFGLISVQLGTGSKTPHFVSVVFEPRGIFTTWFGDFPRQYQAF